MRERNIDGEITDNGFFTVCFLNAYVWRDIYSVGDRKQDWVRERNVDGETTDRYRDGNAS